jgi:hypothetical protein
MVTTAAPRRGHAHSEPIEEVRPRFAHNQVIATRALVIDQDGRAWWVDPKRRTVVLVEFGGGGD